MPGSKRIEADSRMADEREQSSGCWNRPAATQSSTDVVRRRLGGSSSQSGLLRVTSASASPTLLPSESPREGWRSEHLLLREDEGDASSYQGFAPNLLLPSTASPRLTVGETQGSFPLLAVSPSGDSGGSRTKEAHIPLPPGADVPESGSDTALEEDCHEWGVDGEAPEEDESEVEDVDEGVLFWRRMPAGDRLRWAAGRVFRVDTHSVLALPIFFLIAAILTVEVFFYICVRLLIAFTEAVFFHLASLAYWFRSVSLRRVFAAGTPAGKEVSRAALEASARAALAAEKAALEFTGLGVGAPEAAAAAPTAVAAPRALKNGWKLVPGTSPAREQELLGPASWPVFRLFSVPFAFAGRGWEWCRRACGSRWIGGRFRLLRKHEEGRDGDKKGERGEKGARLGSREGGGVACDRERTLRRTSTGSGEEREACPLRSRARLGEGEGAAGEGSKDGAEREERYAAGKQNSALKRQVSLRAEAPEDEPGETLMSHRGKLFKATTYDEYARLALIMDKITGREKWKHELETTLYDYEAVGKRLSILKKARQSGKLSALQEALRGSLRDQMFGVFRERLYSRTYLGTKVQAEEFIDEVCLCLKELRRHVRRRPDEVRRTFQQLQTSWGVTGLILSGGASLGLHHFGVLEVLLKARAEGRNLLPRVIGGCSAGAVVAAWLCTRTDEELLGQGTVEYLVEHWKALSPNSWLFRLWNVLTKGYMCDIDVWKASSKKLFGDLTFLEAYQRTGRVLNISMTRADREESGVQVMNYVTAPNVLIWSAILCSCAFPFLSLPLPLREKSPKGKAVISKVFGCSYFHDGSLSGDIPTEQMREAWAVSYSIVSQVNLHVFPFAGLRTHGEAGIPVHWRGRSSKWRAGFLLSALELFFKEHIRFLLRLIALLDVSPTLRGINAGSLALQSYTGDVTLHPRYISARYLRLLNDTRPSDISWYLQEGRLMAFPKLHLIRNRMRIDRCFEDLAEALEEAAAAFAPAGNTRGVQKVF
ncbi:phospholipase, patatin family protein [Toxoplasma gondii GT1]|uniref:Phospholipase, patatin family protein n=2 Tax=Toxoplasma gondii TaxID=5811 RepID=S7UWG7_TOXGG|nr:phospholipase, patatin family protein [Toxoplasma gondii GT1]